MLRPAGALNKAVSVWVFDKRPQALMGALSPAEREAVMAIARADAAALVRMKHPAVVQVRTRNRRFPSKYCAHSTSE